MFTKIFIQQQRWIWAKAIRMFILWCRQRPSSWLRPHQTIRLNRRLQITCPHWTISFSHRWQVKSQRLSLRLSTPFHRLRQLRLPAAQTRWCVMSDAVPITTKVNPFFLSKSYLNFFRDFNLLKNVQWNVVDETISTNGLWNCPRWYRTARRTSPSMAK